MEHSFSLTLGTIKRSLVTDRLCFVLIDNSITGFDDNGV